MDLLLTHGYCLQDDAKEKAIMKPYPPLGILYLSAYLRKKGFAVEVYDTTFGSWDELIQILQQGPPSAVGIYGTLMTRAGVLRILKAAREAGWTVILGGPEPPNYAQEFLAAGAEVIVQGEGELTLEELLSARRAGEPEAYHRIHGLICLDRGGTLVRTPARALIADLDSLPWPDRERVELGRYLKVWREHHGTGSLSLITARGCPYRCRWCSHATFGQTHRRRSVRNVADEVEWLCEVYAPEMLWIADDVFTIHHPWILQYAEEMKRRALRIPFECITRADRLNGGIADALAALGCFRVWLGSESGSQRILDAMQRGVKVAQVQESVRLCRERGIQTGMFLMWGYEGEEVEDIEATVALVKDTLPDVFLTTVSYPIKGTPYYEQVAARLVSVGDWVETTDRDLKIRGRRSRACYRLADQLLNDEVALQRMLAAGHPADSPDAVQLQARIGEARRELYQCREVEA